MQLLTSVPSPTKEINKNDAQCEAVEKNVGGTFPLELFIHCTILFMHAFLNKNNSRWVLCLFIMLLNCKIRGKQKDKLYI